MPLITAASDGRRMVVAAADRAALALGIRPAMPLAHARAMVPGLTVVDADPEADAAALARVAEWCLRYSPLTASDPSDGVWIDITGCANLHGGEGALLADLLERLGHGGTHARAAVADTPGAAHAVTRFTPEPAAVIAPGAHQAAITPLPIAALRLPPETVGALRRLGFERIGQLAETARGPLVRRFGQQVALRLDQASGRVFEPIQPVVPDDVVAHRLLFIEPLLTAEAFGTVIDELLNTVCGNLEAIGQGARRLDLLFERIDGSMQAIRIGTAAPSRHAAHLAHLLRERLETVDPGLGVEAMQLCVSLAETQAFRQAARPPGWSTGTDPKPASPRWSIASKIALDPAASGAPLRWRATSRNARSPPSRPSEMRRRPPGRSPCHARCACLTRRSRSKPSRCCPTSRRSPSPGAASAIASAALTAPNASTASGGDALPRLPRCATTSR